MDVQHAAASRYTILIGIDDYPDRPLKSCVRDVHDISAFFAYLPRDATSIQTFSTDQADQDPTNGNITAAFQNVTSHANAGDFVYIHYSGHGTRKPPSCEFSNKDTGDLALVLLNKAGDRPSYLWGFELAGLLKAMIDKELIVTLVLDCCFSASVYRSDGTVRFLPYNPTFDTHKPNSTPAQQNTATEATSSILRNISMRSNWLIDPDSCAILTACGPHEEISGYRFNGKSHGALSYFLLAIMKCAGLNTRHREIHHHLRARFQGYGIFQTPVLYGNKDQGLFGPITTDQFATPVIPVTRTTRGVLQLDAGTAHGISDGDYFMLFTLMYEGIDRESQPVSGMAKVIQTQGLTSILEQMEPSSITIRTGWMARASTQSFLKKYPIQLPERFSDGDDWLTALNTRGLHVSADVKSPSAAFHITSNDCEQYTILDDRNEEIVSLPYSSGGTLDPDHVGGILEHLARFKFAKDLANETYTGLCESSEAQVRFDGKEFGADTLLEVKHGSTVEIAVRNRGGKPIYAFIYNLGPLWQVQDIYRGVLVLPRGICTRRLKMKLPDELREKRRHSCIDVVKVILTSRFTSFDVLELPELNGCRKMKKVTRTGKRDDNAEEDWATFNFLFQITLV